MAWRGPRFHTNFGSCVILGLVTRQREGRQVVYELYDDHVADLLEQVVSHVEHLRLGLAGRVGTAETAIA